MSSEYHENWFKERLDNARYVIDPQDGRSYEDIYYQSGLAPEVPGQQELPIDLSTSASPEEARQRLETARALARAKALTIDETWDRVYGA